MGENHMGNLSNLSNDCTDAGGVSVADGMTDAEIGAQVRRCACRRGLGHGDLSCVASVHAASLLLVSQAASLGSDDTRITLEGCTYQGKRIGDWRITVERLAGGDDEGVLEEGVLPNGLTPEANAEEVADLSR